VTPAKQAANEPKYSTAELKAHSVARRRANLQLMRIPWARFRKAYEEYPRWQGLALWTRAVIDAEGRAPTELLRTLREHCPGFFEGAALPCEPNLLAFRLLEWVHNHRFGYAKRQGWLDALSFYGVRHPRSQAAWAFWEHCEKEWSRMPPKALPSFEEWEQRASKMKICGEATCLEVASAVERYIDREATALWLSPLFVSHIKLPAHVVSELEQRFPSLLSRTRSGSDQRIKGDSTSWRSLIRAVRVRCLSNAKAAGWLDGFTERVRSHPRHFRFMAYGKHWGAEWSQDRRQHYPSSRQWRLAADHYSEASSNRHHGIHSP